MPLTDKPPYHVPTMQEIAALPWNGYTVASLFSGGGGSSCGYKMAGFRVRWANEFIPAAADTYRANFPDTILDPRDIRQIQSADILTALQMQPGDLDVLDGSPPCASFSTAGKRERDWGRVKAYSDTQQRTDDLFFEYARLLRGLQPKVFVAENVSGLVKGTAKGYFKLILRELRACGYRVEARLLDAQWLGVPQQRQRIIFIGVRQDLPAAPAFPTPLPYRYSVRDAIGVTLRTKSYAANGWIDGSNPAAAIQASGQYFVEDANGLRSTGQNQGHIWLNVTDTPMPTIQAQRAERLAAPRAYLDKRGAFGNAGDCTDTSAPAVLADSVGTHWVIEPESDMTGYAVGAAWDTLRPGEQSDRYYQLQRAPLDGPSPTVTQRGGDATTASVTHPTERRKFSIAELKRICAFPDDFILTGTYAQQWERCGRAVPPVMMAAIARTIQEQILCKL